MPRRSPPAISAPVRSQSAASEYPVSGPSRIDWWLIAFTLIGLALRAATIDTRGLWLDEALTVRQTTLSIPSLLLSFVGGVHPPLFHILMHFWVSIFGVSEIPLRSFALVFGVAAIPAAYWAALRMFNRRTARVAAGLMAFWPYHIWYSQEARMYSMLMFFALLSVGCLYLAMEKSTFWRWFAFWAVTTMGTFVHYFFALLVVGEVFYYLLDEVLDRERKLSKQGERTATPRRPWRLFADVPTLAPWLIANTLVAVAFAMWTAYAIYSPTTGESALLGSVSSSGLGYGQVVPSFAVRFDDVGLMVTEAVAGFHAPVVMFAIVAMWPFAIYIMLLLFDVMGPIGRRTKLLLWSASGIPVVWVLGQYQGQVLASRYSMALLAPVLILAAAVIAWMPSRARRFVLVLSLVLALFAYADQSFNRENEMRYDNREAITYVATHYRPTDVIIYEPSYTDALFDYYLPKGIPAYGFPEYDQFGIVRDAKVQIGQDCARVSYGSRRVWLVLSFQNIEKLRGDAYNTEMWFLRNGFRASEDLHLDQVELIRYDAIGAPPAPSSTSGAAGGGRP